MTTYKNFADACDSPALVTFRNMVEKYCASELLNGVHWYDFETMISAVSSQWFSRYFSSCSIENEKEQKIYEKEYSDDIAQINSAFTELEDHLKEYLGKATKDRQSNKLESISNEISDNARVISFNYTNVASRYTNNIHYIHGSLHEESIVLGYPLREDPCLMSPEGTLYAKGQLREYLDFKRFLMSKGIALSSTDTEKLLIEMRMQISSLHSNRGEYDIRDDLNEIIEEYMQLHNYNSAQIDLGFSFEDIGELVVIGHSLKADEDIIQEWLEGMLNLRVVKIFTYCGEPGYEIEAKKAFFSKYNCVTEILKY
jgi:hypothetical protein